MRVVALTLGALVSALIASVAIVAPAQATVMSAASLQSALASGDVTLTTDVDDETAELDVGGTVSLDLAGHDVSVLRVHLATNAIFTITDSSPTSATGGTFTADASTQYGSAGIRTTGATLKIGGTVTVIAKGSGWSGQGGAGIGGDTNGGGGTTRVSGSAQVTATGRLGAAGIGAGLGGAYAGILTIVDDAVVTVNADAAANALGSPRSIGQVTIGADATLVIPVNQKVVIGGQGSDGVVSDGTIVVNGTLTGAGSLVTNGGSIAGTGTLSVPGLIGNAYAITFTPTPGTLPDTTITVYADSIAAAGKTLPAPTAPSGSAFDSWNYGSAVLTATTSLSALFGSSTGAVVEKTVSASYKPVAAVSLAAFTAPVTYGTTATLSATVTGGASGTVEFFDGATSLGSATVLGGTATLPVSLTVGSHSITAHFTGDAAGTSAPSVLTVTQAATAISLGLGRATLTAGGSTRLTATVTPSIAPGTVTFYSDGTPIGTSALQSGVALLQSPTTLDAGDHEITADYTGTKNYSFSTTGSSSVLTVTAATSVPTSTPTSTPSSSPSPTPSGTTDTSGTPGATGATGATGAAGTTMVVSARATTTAVWLSTFAASYGTAVRATAHVADGATGTVLFAEGGHVLGTAAVASGYAVLDLPVTMAVGPHVITATYSGDASFAGSASVAGTLSIAKATTTISVKGRTFAKHSKPKFVLKIAKGARGPVAIYVGTKKVTTVKLTKAKTTVTLKKRYAAILRVKAVFAGSAGFARATSKTVRVRAK